MPSTSVIGSQRFERHGAPRHSRPGTIRQLDESTAGSTDSKIEFDALVKIVEMQAQALNDVIISANNLQGRVAALEERLSTPVTNGKKDNKIIRLN